MAKRPVFLVGNNIENMVIEKEFDFKWYSGLSISQKQKSIDNLHEKFMEQYSDKNILEISTKSTKSEGIALSAFNLAVNDKNGERICSLECLFQGCKKFEKGGPYRDIWKKTSIEAKRDERLKTSGNLVGFEYKGQFWGLEPKTYFYDWIYINSVHQNIELREKIIKYNAFTDIEFNPKKSINNQARSAALYVALYRLDLIERIIGDKEYYFDLVKNKEIKQMKLEI